MKESLPLLYQAVYLVADIAATIMSVATGDNWYTTDERWSEDGITTYKIYLAKGDRRKQNIKRTLFKCQVAC